MWQSCLAWLRRRLPWRQRSLGERGERFAARYLKRLGYTIVARDARSHLGELDIVAVDATQRDRRVVVFVEVRTRSDTEHGRPVDTVDEEKQRRVSRAALAYLKRHRLLGCPTRFDVIAVVWPPAAKQPTIEHYRAAFEARGNPGMFG